MMTYFEVKKRLKNLTRFRNLYQEYLNFPSRRDYVPANIVRNKMVTLLPLTVDSLRKIRMGILVTRIEPSRGGKKVKINLIKAIFREHLIIRFSLDEQAPLKILNRAVTKYQRLLWAQAIQLFNPLFWLYHFFDFIVRLPFKLLVDVGLKIDNLEESTLARLYIAASQIILFYYVFKVVGFIDWIKGSLVLLRLY